MLPLEDQTRAAVEAEHAEELAVSRDLLQLALEMMGSKGNGQLSVPNTPVPGVTDRARALALGLFAKACRQFRGIILLAERGFGGEVAIFTRSLFDTTLAMNFIMNETVALKEGGKPFDPDPSRPLDTDLRTLLYIARSALMQDKRYREWSARPELHTIMHLRGTPEGIAAQTAAAREAVGEKWWNALKKGQAGLYVKDLADSLGALPYYVIFYGDQSEVAHAGDGLTYFNFEDDAHHASIDLCPSSDGVGVPLRVAEQVFISVLAGIHNRLKFGEAVEKKLDAIETRLGELSETRR